MEWRHKMTQTTNNHHMIITDITACSIPSPNIWNSWKQSHHGLDNFLRDLLWQTSQLQLKLASVANNPHLLCTCWGQIMQFDCIITQRAELSYKGIVTFESWSATSSNERMLRVWFIFYINSSLVNLKVFDILYLDVCYPKFCGKTLSTLWFYVSGHIKYNLDFTRF